MEINITTLKEVLRGTMRYNLLLAINGAKAEDYKVDYIEGPPGSAKTASVRQVAEEIGNDIELMTMASEALGIPATYASRTFIAAQWLAEDVGGFPWVDNETRVMYRSIPGMLPMSGMGVWNMDEVSKGAKVHAVLGQALHERRIGEHRIAPGWTITLTGNRRKDRSGDVDLPRYLLDRLTKYEVMVTRDEWLLHGINEGFHDSVIWFLKASGDEWFNTFDPALDINPTARSWESLSNVMNHNVYKGLALRATIEGRVGPQAGHAFYSYLAVRDKLPDPESVLRDPKNAPIPSSHQARMALMGALAANVKRPLMTGFNEYLVRFDKEVDHGKEASVFAVQMVKHRDKALFTTDGGIEILTRYAEDVLG